MWHKVYFNKQNIEYDTGKAVLIKLPLKSEYAGYTFWHPSKLIKEEGAKGYHVSFYFSDTWVFNIFKSGKRKKLDELSLSSDEMLNAFEIVHEEISGRKDISDDHYLIVEKPAPFNPKGDINECLKNN